MISSGTPAATPSIGVAALSVRISPPLVGWTEFWQTLRIARGIAGIRLIDRDKAAVDLPQMRQAIHLPEPLACLRRLLRGGFLEGQECARESCSNDSRNSSPPAGDTRFLWRRPAWRSTDRCTSPGVQTVSDRGMTVAFALPRPIPHPRIRK